MRIDFDELVGDPLLDVDEGVYLDAETLPLSMTSKARLRDLQRRWASANERYAAGGDIDAPVDASFTPEVKDLELRLRRELAGTRWSLIRNGRAKG